MDLNQIFANIRTKFDAYDKTLAQLAAAVAAGQGRVKSPQEKIDEIPGRRFPMWLSTDQDFTASKEGSQGAAMVFKLSQDGPFVMTHFPAALWRPTVPITATNYLQWRPVFSVPRPAETTTADYIDISYEMQDAGPGQNFQDNPSIPILSQPNAIIPLPIPTLFAAGSTVQFTPTYEQIVFNGSTPPTTGTLRVTLIGYRIFNR